MRGLENLNKEHDDKINASELFTCVECGAIVRKEFGVYLNGFTCHRCIEEREE